MKTAKKYRQVTELLFTEAAPVRGANPANREARYTSSNFWTCSEYRFAIFMQS